MLIKLTVVFNGHSLTSGDGHPVVFGEGSQRDRNLWEQIDQSTTQDIPGPKRDLEGWRISANLDTGEGSLFPILADDKRACRAPVIQHISELQDLQILVANILDGSDDPHVGQGLDFVGGG